MKFLLLFCLIFIVTCFIPSGKFDPQFDQFSFELNRFLALSFPRRSNRLQQFLRKHPWQRKTQSSVSPIGQQQHLLDGQIHSTEYEDVMRIRNTWDSGEDYYFQWANQHRRPVEYLAGRKRDTSKNGLPPRERRINGGLWRSGLVG